MDHKERKAWAPTLVAGDKVAVRNGGHGLGYSLRTIVKVTATQLVLDDHQATRVNREDGSVRGTSYKYIEPVTQEVLDSIEAGDLKRWLNMLTWNHTYPSLHLMRAMKAAYDEASAAKAAT
jgi:hypothetical protein